MILDEGTVSLEKRYLFNKLKENATFINMFRPMYTDLDGYPLYSGAISGFFETNSNANIYCDNGYIYSSSKQINSTCIIEESW